MNRLLAQISVAGGAFPFCLLMALCAPRSEAAQAASTSVAQFDPYTPLFTKASTGIAQTMSPSYTDQLVYDAIRYEPLLLRAGTQVHMGFWSGPDNHGRLAKIIDNIDFGATPCDSRKAEPNCAIWDEGTTTSEQYPLYVTMLREHWYERGNTPEGSPVVQIYGQYYYNTNPLSFSEGNSIWGQYSQRYADMAMAFYNYTGKKVQVWAVLLGARSDRVFFTFEKPELELLEHAGIVTVHCTVKTDPDWRIASDWTIGTMSPDCMPKTKSTPSGPVTVNNR